MATKLQTPTPCKNVSFRLNPNTFVRTGYNFLGWSETWQSSTAKYSDNELVTFDGDRDLYAVWQANQYQVTFDANGGTGGWSQMMDYEATITPPTVTRDGYGFTGWQPSVDATVPLGGATYVAQWEQINLDA